MMRSRSRVQDFEEKAFNLLRDLIYARTGLYYGDDRCELLEEKLAPLVAERGFNSYLDYYRCLKDGTCAALEWQRLIDAITVQESYFWREMGQVHALVEDIVPAYVAQHPGQTLRIWSAACATGEEPLTIAMALEEAGWFARASIEIVASDISAAALARARRGWYRARAFRNLPRTLQRKYFTPVNEGWQVLPALQRRIQWRQANLVVREEILDLATAPVIFCRNVFIYFSREMARRVVELFAEQMSAPGYLCLGAAESLFRVTTAFRLEQIGEGLIYVKAT